MKVSIHFADGERLEGDSATASLTTIGFPVVPKTGNSTMVWVSLSAIKYVLVHSANVEAGDKGGDPRARRGLPKVVVRFQDGEVIRTYRDDVWGPEGEGFKLRIWDPQSRAVVPALISFHNLKGIFFVKEWDSRSAREKLVLAGRRPLDTATDSPAPVNADHAGDHVEQLARDYRGRLAQVRDQRLATRDPNEFAAAVRDHLGRLLAQDGRILSESDLRNLCELILRSSFGYGPLDVLLADPTVSEIMVNGPERVFVERNGKLQKSPHSFRGDQEVLDVISKMASSVGRRIDESNPTVDARLADGSRINAVIPPASVDGPTLTIRKFTKFLYDASDLIEEGTLSLNMAVFLHHAVMGGASLLISGGTGCGKTTTLNVLGSLIPEEQRVVTIEDTAELQLQHPHVVRLEYRPPNVEGRGEVTIRQLLRNSLRMRPDRIIVGEARGPEALEMLQAMNTGHDGSMSTIHANSAADALTRLETMVLSASIDLPLDAVRAQILSAIDLVVHQVRRPDGKRKMVQISELVGYEDGRPVLRDIFAFESDSNQGSFQATGVLPRCLAKLERQGVKCPVGIFDDQNAGSEAEIPQIGNRQQPTTQIA
jgi:pilus assembly protein CpaF